MKLAFMPHPDPPQQPAATEADIPAEWRIPEGAILKTEFTPEESEQVELDRR